MNHKKYMPQPIIDFPQRTWPGKRLEKAPIWCSVDLRDGNQSLEIPMSLPQKLAFFRFLVQIGFKEIEVGFPSASDTEFLFLRTLIEQNLIPDDVTIQVLTQSREPLIRRTFESLKGARKAIVHLYNATSPLHRDVVFGKSKAETTEMAVFGAKLFTRLADEMAPTRFAFEYSPECFSQTEPDYAVEVVNAVLKCWEGREAIINLPFTVETATPNVHADMVEYMCGKMHNRDKVTVSLHAHNDRGTAVAATELCLLAGADRVEGTLFGNGERTGNADLITLAMNLYAQGIDHGLDFSEIDKAIDMYTQSTALPVHPRHPYAGSLVYTAFSGSHQDAIRKGMAHAAQSNAEHWAMPYLPVDPMDVGRSYDPIIRVNSQSGAAASAYILETRHGLLIPKAMQRDFGPIVTQMSDQSGAEVSPKEVYALFKENYINLAAPLEYLPSSKGISNVAETVQISCSIKLHGNEHTIRGEGDGVLEAFCYALTEETGIAFDIKGYSQHALDAQDAGKRARAITYVEIVAGGKSYFGAGVSGNITTSSIRAVVSAVNRCLTAQK